MFLPAFCVETNGMDDPSILADDQIVTSDFMATGSLRPDDSPAYSTDLPVVNVTLELTSDEYAEAPQLGKIDIHERLSMNVAYYKVGSVCTRKHGRRFVRSNNFKAALCTTTASYC